MVRFSGTDCNISLGPVVQDGADVSSVQDGDEQASGEGNKMVAENFNEHIENVSTIK